MPYKIKKYKTGFKVCKKNSSKCFSKKPLTKEKATNQLKALYANEKLNEKLSTKQVGNNLKFKSVAQNPIKNTVVVTYSIKSEVNADVRIVYSLGENLIQTDYIRFEILDHNDPKGKPVPFEDPESSEAKDRLKVYDLTSEDILMAGQDGYDKIDEYVFTLTSLKDPYEESFNFELVYKNTITR